MIHTTVNTMVAEICYIMLVRWHLPNTPTIEHDNHTRSSDNQVIS